MKHLLFLLMVLLFCCGNVNADLYLAGKTDKNPLAYRVGETITFRVALFDNGRMVPGKLLRWTRYGDDGKTLKGKAASDRELVLTTSIDRPGFIRLEVFAFDADGKKLRGYPDHREVRFHGGAAADVEKISSWPEVPGMDEFWKKQLKALRAIPMNLKLAAAPGKAPKIRSVTFESPIGPDFRPATGWISMPVDAKPKSLPITLYYHSYSCYGIPPYHGYVFNRGGQIVISVSGYGLPAVKDVQIYRDFEKNHLKGFGWRGNDKPETCDFLGMILRDVRSLDLAKTLPEWNGKDIIVSGGSMGAFQALAVAALAPETVTGCEVTIPWMTGIAGKSKQNRLGGWAPDYTEALSFYDTVNFAKRISCPVTIVAGLGDYICPPSGQIALFHNLRRGPVKLKFYQNMEHGKRYQPGDCGYTLAKNGKASAVVVQSFESGSNWDEKTIFETSLDSPLDFYNWPCWPNFAATEESATAQVLAIRRAPGVGGDLTVTKWFDKREFSQCSGKRIKAAVDVKGSEKDLAALRFGLLLRAMPTPAQKSPVVQKEFGDGWKKIEFSANLVPEAKGGGILLGLTRDGQGPVYFRNLSVIVTDK
ncbi:MAG: acetylxylan esterase [Victivallaceae bacterium]|nr:acetylxylan esterase [Victivallaceae bacterium]